MTYFNEYISHFDMHVYFEKDTPAEHEAMLLQETLRQQFPSVPLFKAHRDPIGPHPVGMWEGHILNEQIFSKLVPWLGFNRGSLSILVHPNSLSREGRRDHEERALWLGTPQKLNLAIFSQF